MEVPKTSTQYNLVRVNQTAQDNPAGSIGTVTHIIPPGCYHRSSMVRIKRTFSVGIGNTAFYRTDCAMDHVGGQTTVLVDNV